MFRTTNPYDELIIKATDEKLTSEDWGLNLELCDKVTEDKEAGARNATSALQKRLAHRNPNVQLFALELTNTLSENCGSYIHQEIASKSFTEGLERVVTDRTTNDKVRKKVLALIRKWVADFESNPDLGIMGELYERLRRNNDYSSALTESTLHEPPPDDEIARTRAAAEEEEMQRAIELSKQDKGGRGAYATASNNQPASSSSSSAPANSNHRSHSPPRSSSQAPLSVPRPITPPLDQATRVRALYDYTPTNPTELSFKEGDIIKVIGRTYDQWWRGTLRGRVGIMPVNYLQALPVLSEEEMRKEQEEEDEVFQGVARFDELLEKLRGVDVARGDRVEDSREIEELYATCIGMQSRISNLIQKYAGQKADLEQISNIFNEASHQYQLMKNPQAPPPQAYAQPVPHNLPPQTAYTASPEPHQQPPQHHQQPPAQQQQQPYQAPPQQQQHPRPQSSISPQSNSAQMSPEWQAYYAQQAAQAQGQANLVPGQNAGAPPTQQWPGQPSVQQQGAAPLSAGPSGRQSPAYDPYRQQHPQHPQQPPPHSQPSYSSNEQQQQPPSGLPTTLVTAPTISRDHPPSHHQPQHGAPTPSLNQPPQQQQPYGSQDGHSSGGEGGRPRPGSWAERAASTGGGGYAIAAQYHQQTQAQREAQAQQQQGYAGQ